MASFHWVANREITVKDNRIRKEGEFVPEVETWKDPDLWERAGHIRKVPGPAPGLPFATVDVTVHSPVGIERAEAATEPEPEPKPEPEKYLKSELTRMKKAALQSIASGFSLAIDDDATRPDIITAIMKAQQEG